MYVAGATSGNDTPDKKLFDHFLLIPGIGTQGGSLDEVHV